MFSKSQLLDAIEELEASPATFQNAEKLATFYTLYDHLFIQKEPMNRIESVKEVKIDRYGDSEFLEAITDKKPEDVWSIMDELDKMTEYDYTCTEQNRTVSTGIITVTSSVSCVSMQRICIMNLTS